MLKSMQMIVLKVGFRWNCRLL